MAVFYRVDQRDYDTRNRQYSEAMERVYKSYPDDQEEAVFYALSLLTWNPDSQRPLANSDKAIGILDQVFRENPGHPGVAHYLIHAADTPQLAPMRPVVMHRSRRQPRMRFTCLPTFLPGSASGRRISSPTSRP